MRTRPAKLLSILLAISLVTSSYAALPGRQKPKIPKLTKEQREKNKAYAQALKEAEEELKLAQDEAWKILPKEKKQELKKAERLTNDVTNQYWKDQIQKGKDIRKNMKGPGGGPFDLPTPNDNQKPDENGIDEVQIPKNEGAVPGVATGKGSKRWLPLWVPICFFFDPKARNSEAANAVVRSVVNAWGMCGVAVKPIMKTIIPGSYPDDPGAINANAKRICNADVGYGVSDYSAQSHPLSTTAADRMCDPDGKPPKGAAGCAAQPGVESICDVEGAGAAVHELGHNRGKPGAGGDELVNAGDGKGPDGGEGLQLKNPQGAVNNMSGGGNEGSGGGGGFSPQGCASIRGGAQPNDRNVMWDPMKKKYFKHKNPKRWLNFSTAPPLWKSPKSKNVAKAPPTGPPPGAGKRQLQEGGGVKPPSKPDIGKEQESHILKNRAQQDLKGTSQNKLVGNAVQDPAAGPQRTLGDTGGISGGFDVDVTAVGKGSNRLIVIDGKYQSDGGGKGPQDLPAGREIAGGATLGGTSLGGGSTLKGGKLINNENSSKRANTNMGTNEDRRNTNLMGGFNGSISTYEGNSGGTSGPTGGDTYNPTGKKSYLDGDFMQKVGSGQAQPNQAPAQRGEIMRRASDREGSPTGFKSSDRIQVDRGVMFQADTPSVGEGSDGGVDED